MLTSIQAVILGVVEGLTEFLPISSTAHLLLTSKLIGIAQTAEVKTFEIAIQSGAILAVVAYYWKRLIQPHTIKQLLVAFIPTGVLGFLFYKIIKQLLLESPTVMLWALAIGGICLIAFEYYFAKRKSTEKDNASLNTKSLVLIGIFQSIAFIPGVSRSAATIIGGKILGLSREAIVEFSFLLAVPTMLAATAYDLLKSYQDISIPMLTPFAIGFATAFATALACIHFFLAFIRHRHTFIIFGLYRIFVALSFWFFFW